jgi:2-dehydro-3-deoxy-D-arabinonate dehydratase
VRTIRYQTPEGDIRVAFERPAQDVPGCVLFDELDGDDVLAALAGCGVPSGRTVEAEPGIGSLRAGHRLLRPLDPPEVWCAGVTYERSRDARIDEATVKDVYTMVYDADRPELFLKDAMTRRTVGPGDPIGVRSDSAWNVPEPEVGLVLGDRGAILGYTIGNDVSSRDIEGANPLYLPQAKVYAGACAIGPALVGRDADEPFELTMRIIDQAGAELFAGSTSTARMRRSFADLAAWLVRDNPVPTGSVLLTGTGLVPPDDFTLLPGHRVEIGVAEIGTLVNPVVSARELMRGASP